MTKPRILFVSTASSYRNHAFIRAAQSLSMNWLLTCDTAVTGEYANNCLIYNPNDYLALITILKNLHLQETFVSCMALDDSGAHIAQQIAFDLGLPHNSAAATEAARNKYAMRLALQTTDIPLPWFRHFDTSDEITMIAATVPYPCVIKPLELNGSRGVMRADTPAQFLNAHSRLIRMLASLYPNQTVYEFLVESFIPGQEVALEAMMDNGVLVPLALFDKPDPLDGPFFEETIYVTPSRQPEATQASIYSITQIAAKAIGLVNGPVHAELRINNEGIYIVEIAGRSIGGLCSQTLRFGSDESLEMLIVRQASGLLVTTPTRSNEAGGVMMIPIPHSGFLQQVNGTDLALTVPLIESIEITSPLHRPIFTLPEGESYLGFIFARGQDPASVEQALRDAHALLQIQITPDIRLI
ncbi:MAG: ATP-grasp domain-containing protein [Chloroflexales bacterium]|nr:ATP-grasp domain-containing protein [Chloroflexales bacterium]